MDRKKQKELKTCSPTYRVPKLAESARVLTVGMGTARGGHGRRGTPGPRGPRPSAVTKARSSWELTELVHTQAVWTLLPGRLPSVRLCLIEGCDLSRLCDGQTRPPHSPSPASQGPAAWGARPLVAAALTRAGQQGSCSQARLDVENH